MDNVSSPDLTVQANSIDSCLERNFKGFLKLGKKILILHNTASFLWGGGIDRTGVRNQYIFITRVFITVVAATVLMFGVLTPLSPVIVVICAGWIGLNVLSVAVKAVSERFLTKDSSEKVE